MKKKISIFAFVALTFFACSGDSISQSSSSNFDFSSSSLEDGSEDCAGFDENEKRMHYGKEKPQICDERDGKRYVYVKIGTQTWMAENLNYDGGNGKTGVCYGNVNGNCNTYGRLYILEEAACPYGWHLPSSAEWQTLINFVHPNPNDGTYFLSTAGTKLKASSGWGSGNGTDDYGFAALPGGYCGNACPVDNNSFTNINASSYWWTTSVGSPVPLSITYTISAAATSVNEMQSYSTSRFYARCVLDQSSSSSSEDVFSSSSLSSSSSSSEEAFSSSSSKPNSLLVNFTSDLQKGELRWMDTDSTSLVAEAISFGQDTKVSAHGGNIFVLSRFPGLLTCILPQAIGEASAMKQNSLNAQNPYEAAVIGDKGYLALEDVDYVQVFNTSTCAPSGTINLPIAGTNASSIKASGDTLFVILQRREGLKAPKPGLLVRIRASTETVIDTIQLKFHNPFASVLSKGKLYVASAKYDNDENPAITDIDLAKSGIEVVNLAAGTTEVLVTGTQLGGGADGLAMDEANQILYVSVQINYRNQPVKLVNVAGKSVGEALPNILDSFGGIVFDDIGKKLFVGDRYFRAPSLKIYDPATNSTTVVSQGSNALSPYSLAIVRW